MNKRQQKLFEENQGLIYFAINRVRDKIHRHLDEDEAYSIGLEILWRAALKFNPKKGFKFSTYATCSMIRTLCRESEAAANRKAKQVFVPEKFGPSSYVKVIEKESAEKNSEVLAFAIKNISPENRQVLSELYFMGHTLKSIAKKHGKSTSWVRDRANLAKDEARDIIEKNLLTVEL